MSIDPIGSAARPAVDERLVVSECGYEIVDGTVVAVTPAFEPHARRHAKIAALLEAHVAEGFTVAVDLLTRTGPREDFAPDLSLFASARNPLTGGRQLEEIAFEVVSSETLAHAGAKAAKLRRRGVRRVFAIDVERERTLEWSTDTDAWEILATNATLDDPLFVTPLPVRDLVDVARADDALARALIAKHNPVIEDALVRSFEDGELAATAAAIVAVLAARGFTPTAIEHARIVGLRDPDLLARWLARAATCAAVADVLRA